ncbi:MAG: HD domain-containing protein [Eubacterium sp.]|nr:HD domain-containing protein [Eubacterium sp.]
MKKYFESISSNNLRRNIFTIFGMLFNVLMAFLMYKTGLPFYFDTIGTIVVTVLGGVFPGILTAVMSNVLCSLFNPHALYFTVINAIIALCTSWIVNRSNKNKVFRLIFLVLSLAIISGSLSAFIQWQLYGGPQNEGIAAVVNGIRESSGISPFLIYLFINIIINIIDKGISVLIALLILWFLPGSIKNNLLNSRWKQRSLSREEKKDLYKWSKDVNHSVRTRIILLISIISFLLMVIIVVGTSLFSNHVKSERISALENVTKLSAELIDADMVDEYIATNGSVEGYEETRDLLYKVKDTSTYIDNLYVLKFTKDDGCYYIFEIVGEGEELHSPSKKVFNIEEYESILADLKAGKEITPLEEGNLFYWNIRVFNPVYNDEGQCVCYTIADISMDLMADYNRIFLFKMIIILAGFIILMMSGAIWFTDMFTVYPINSIASMIDGFVEVKDDQEKLDAQVRKLRKLDIRTDDEIEKMYISLCKMAASTAEQMREIRYYTESTAKMQNGIIITMADMVESRDSDTGAHIQKTAAYVRIILNGLKKKGYYAEKLTPKYMADVEMSAPLHDVGKVNIPDSVLNKPGKLTPEEYEIMKTHTTAGKKIIEKAISTVKGESYLREARNMAGYHHERWDGKGYPEGLHGEVIPLSARIMAVADVFDALASPRVYKPAFPFEKAIAIIQEGAGTQFDPKCVEVFMDSLDEVKEVLKKYQDPDGGNL